MKPRQEPELHLENVLGVIDVNRLEPYAWYWIRYRDEHGVYIDRENLTDWFPAWFQPAHTPYTGGEEVPDRFVWCETDHYLQEPEGDTPLETVEWISGPIRPPGKEEDPFVEEEGGET